MLDLKEPKIYLCPSMSSQYYPNTEWYISFLNVRDAMEIT